MTLKKLPLEGFTEKNQMVLKVNEIIDYINKVEAMFGMELPEAPPKASRDLYKEEEAKDYVKEYRKNQDKGNEV